jgi:hypothetical protein
MMASPVAIMGAWWQIMSAGRFSMASRYTSEAIAWGTLLMPSRGGKNTCHGLS